ncbi:MAG: 16S rRNA (cytidine(1402)-2'-O)-methyltransferase [Candidatus Ancillula trichonymphae]|jgi:16S rRNA (cytidine1402-2'-O)-methyltransferase|nr:16S rRNA (cytidine(1402)-2'-O)-methyltransferase [Candidatus Ancillula trichonymphae]
MLTLAATPIGNHLDASARLVQKLEEADVVLAEDTRVFADWRKRLNLHLHAKVVSLHDHNESSRLESLLSILQAKMDVVLVSDAGLPLINDPGYKLVQLAISNGIPMTCIPGPSAPLTALVLSGLPVHRFTFEGFLPPKTASRLAALRKLQTEERTMIFLESKYRVTRCLEDMFEVFGESRHGAICRELTKPHEEVVRAKLVELVEVARKRELKGEICLVTEGAR